jgi:UDP-glucuronate decarboxylase
MKTILIAGGAGFIGSNLCEYLLFQNNRIICLDNLYTGFLCNIEFMLNNKNFKFINHDITKEIIIDEDIDEIYHLACPASPEKYQKDSIYTLNINFNGTLNLLKLAKEKNSKFLLTSTSEIYGEPKISPQPETYRGNVNTIGIRSCYDEGKRIAETLVMDFNRNYNLDTRVARIFNTYGKKMNKNDGRVVTNFIKQMINNEDITIYGNGLQTRSFCYIEDQINGLTKLMKSDYIYPVNIGNTREITILKLIDILYVLIPETKSKIINKSLPLDDPTNRCPDISLAISKLNWYPKVDIDVGLINTINYIKKNN